MVFTTRLVDARRRHGSTNADDCEMPRTLMVDPSAAAVGGSVATLLVVSVNHRSELFRIAPDETALAEPAPREVIS
jgi:hypothetical protein